MRSFLLLAAALVLVPAASAQTLVFEHIDAPSSVAPASDVDLSVRFKVHNIYDEGASYYATIEVAGREVARQARPILRPKNVETLALNWTQDVSGAVEGAVVLRSRGRSDAEINRLPFRINSRAVAPGTVVGPVLGPIVRVPIVERFPELVVMPQTNPRPTVTPTPRPGPVRPQPRPTLPGRIGGN